LQRLVWEAGSGAGFHPLWDFNEPANSGKVRFG
jgi:hypothetical protein